MYKKIERFDGRAPTGYVTFSVAERISRVRVYASILMEYKHESSTIVFSVEDHLMDYEQFRFLRRIRNGKRDWFDFPVCSR